MKPIQKLTKAFILALIICSCQISCNNDDNLTLPQDEEQNQDHDAAAFAQNFGTEITRSFLGTVIDINENPIENVSITIGNSMAMTDANGIFIINDATINERFGYVKAQKAGFIHASRAVVPSSGTNKVRIMMLPENVAGSTSSGTQETIALPNGASVALEGEYIKEDGSAYSGTVDVILHHLDPAEETMRDQMPGMLYAANAQNEERMLQTFGMLAVELRGSTGEDLNLAEGSTAEITVPLDPGLFADAPATIPLWYFDEANGYWIEDGQATLVGDAYVGTVSHFSFWNCDIPAEAIILCINITDSQNNTFSGLYLEITSSTYGTTYGFTNENGQVCGYVPTNESLILNIYNYGQCNEFPIYSETIGPFETDSSITISLDIDDIDLIAETIVGNFNTCDGNPVENGYVILYNNFNVPIDFAIIDNGDFELSTVRCSSSSNIFGLEAIDLINLQSTGTISFTYTSPITNVLTITSCNALEEFLSYQVDDNQPITYNSGFLAGLDSANILSIYVNDFVSGGNNHFDLQLFSGDLPVNIGSYDTGSSLDFNDQYNSTMNFGFDNTLTINISSIGNTGEFIDLTFNGIFLDNQTIEHTIYGIIHVARDY